MYTLLYFDILIFIFLNIFFPGIVKNILTKKAQNLAINQKYDTVKNKNTNAERFA